MPRLRHHFLAFEPCNLKDPRAAPLFRAPRSQCGNIAPCRPAPPPLPKTHWHRGSKTGAAGPCARSIARGSPPPILVAARLVTASSESRTQFVMGTGTRPSSGPAMSWSWAATGRQAASSPRSRAQGLASQTNKKAESQKTCVRDSRRYTKNIFRDAEVLQRCGRRGPAIGPKSWSLAGALKRYSYSRHGDILLPRKSQRDRYFELSPGHVLPLLQSPPSSACAPSASRRRTPASACPRHA